MSTAMRTASLGRRREPFSSGILRWAAARPALASITLTLVYVVTIAALVAVLSADALLTPVGFAVLVLFAAEVLAFTAIAAYTLMPER